MAGAFTGHFSLFYALLCRIYAQRKNKSLKNVTTFKRISYIYLTVKRNEYETLT